MLFLISLGVCNIKDMSLNSYEKLKKAHKIYLENYTSKTPITPEKLSQLLNKEVIEITREELEDNLDRYLEESTSKDIAICVIGDVLAATTHITIIQKCKERNIPYEITHGSSIFTAIAKTGLSLYRFGRVVSLPHPRNFPTYPTTIFERIKDNQKLNLHTLVLLDIGLRCYEGLILLEKNLSLKEVVCCYMLGCKEEKILYGSVKNVKEKCKEWNDMAQCIIIPAEMEFYEKEACSMWKIK